MRRLTEFVLAHHFFQIHAVPNVNLIHSVLHKSVPNNFSWNIYWFTVCTSNNEMPQGFKSKYYTVFHIAIHDATLPHHSANFSGGPGIVHK